MFGSGEPKCSVLGEPKCAEGGVTSGEISDARNVGVSPGEDGQQGTTIIPRTNVLYVILLDYLCTLA